MKKTMLFILIISLLPYSLAIGQQEQAEEKPDPMKNFSLVDETQPVTEKLKVGFESITGNDAVTYLKFISDDLLEGRDTASDGYDIAALYAATMFELWGIKPAGDMERPRMDFRRMMMQGGKPPAQGKRGYFQNITFLETLGSEGQATVTWQKGLMKKKKSFSSEMDYTYMASGTQSITAPVVFVGYGIQESSLKFDEYKNIDVKGKFVMMLSEAPGKGDPESPFNKGELKEKYYPERRPMMRRRRSTSPKFKVPTDMGAEAVLLIENSPEENGDVPRQYLNAQRINDERPIYPGTRRRISFVDNIGRSMFGDSIPTIRISRKMANDILGMLDQNVESLKEKIEETITSHSMVLSGVTLTVENKTETKLVNSMNVLGYIEGSDPELKNEAVVIGAHLDHLGRRGDYIFNGADDDGSGSVGVMEIAEAFAKNPVKPKRSIVFALWTGEEKGLLGSRYYVAHPFIEKTAANLNLDMISREYDKETLARMSRRFGVEVGKEVLEKIDAKKFVSFSFDANTPAIDEIMRKNNNHVGLHLRITGSKEATGGSDHAPFGQAKIPWAFFIAAMTEDYHQPSDSVDKVSPELMEKIIRLAYLAAFDLADK
ncbi:MAG: M20/M25/M40 family metallo-hydrolase [Candidatus Aminicenantes bacterium]|nr:MAG: M20/M25/M40 family metallo-hydrolase [Candidatus Aminicenantes bacterium]